MEYLNKGNRLRVLQLGKNTPVTLAIEQLAVILKELNVMTVIFVDMQKEEVLHLLLDSDEIGKRVRKQF